jgi:hypothetical protein
MCEVGSQKFGSRDLFINIFSFSYNHGSQITSLSNFASILDKVNYAVYRVKNYHMKNPIKKIKSGYNNSLSFTCLLRSRICDFKNHNHRESG